jgi:hypothetical protein
MGKKIIVADDNRTFLMYMGLLLKRFDFEVFPAEDGLDVLRLIKLVGAARCSYETYGWFYRSQAYERR